MVGKHLQGLRVAAGMSLADVAAAIGIGRSTVHKWETGEVRILAAHLARYLDAVGASADARAEALRLAGEHAAPSDVADTSTSGANGPSPVITATPAVPKLSADDEHTAPTTDPPSSVVLSGVCLACSGRGQVAGEDCDACDCTGRVLLISGDEAADAA
jgi:transcriptional regulator with XRE-family HTH domain